MVLERQFSWNCLENNTIFFHLSPIVSHIHSLQVENCDSNSRLVVDEYKLIQSTSQVKARTTQSMFAGHVQLDHVDSWRWQNRTIREVFINPFIAEDAFIRIRTVFVSNKKITQIYRICRCISLSMLRTHYNSILIIMIMIGRLF